MCIKIVLISLGILLTQSAAFAQKVVGVSFGFPKIDWDYEGSLDGLRTVYRNGWSITLSGSKITERGLLYGLEAGVNRYGNGFQYDRMRFDIKEIHHFNISSHIGYEYTIEGSKFSIRPMLGVGIGLIPIENKYYVEDKTFQIRRIRLRDANGNFYSEPLYDLTFSGSQTVNNRIFPLLKPSVELHYSVGENSSVFVKGMLGITVMNKIIERDFPDVVLEGDNYFVNHSTSLSYSALELGYSLKLRK